MEDTNKKNQILNFIRKNQLNILILFLFMVTMGFIGVALFLFSNDFKNVLNKITNTQNQDSTTEKDKFVPISLTQEKKTEVYKNLLARNESILKNLNGLLFESSSRGGSEANVKVGLGSPGYYVGQYNGYVNYVYEHKIGPKECKTIFNNNDIYSRAKYTLTIYSNKDLHYTKTIYEDPDHGLFFFQVTSSNYKTGLLEDINYYGGDYAVRISHQNPVYDNMKSDLEFNNGVQNVPIYDNSDYQEDFKNFLGDDVEILGEKNINGRKYYVVRYSYYVNCDENYFQIGMPIGMPNVRSTMNLQENKSASNNDLIKIIQELYIDQETYDIYKNITYLGSNSSDNLIKETTISTVRKDVPFDLVKDEFKFDLNVEIRDFKQPTYNRDEDVQKRKNYFDSLNFSYLIPAQSDVNLVAGYLDYYEVPDYQSAMNDRRFFPKGNFGDKVYKFMVLDVNFSVPKVTYSFNVNGVNQLWTVQLLNASSIEEVLRKNYSHMNSNDLKIDNIKMNISGTQVDAAKINMKFKVSDYSNEGEEINTREEISYDFIVSYKGNIYFIKVNDAQAKDVDISNVLIMGFDKDSKEFNEFRQYIFSNL